MTSHLVISGNIILFRYAFVKVTTIFNWSLGNISRKKSSCIIFLEIGDPGKIDSPNIIFNRHWQKGTYFSLVPSTYHFHFFWWNSTTTSSYLSVKKRKEMAVALSVVEVPEELVEALLVEHVIDGNYWVIAVISSM